MGGADWAPVGLCDFSATEDNILQLLRFVKPEEEAMGSELTVMMMSGQPSSAQEMRWTKEYIH